MKKQKTELQKLGKGGKKEKEMHKTFKMRVMSLLLAVVMVLTNLPMTILTANAEKSSYVVGDKTTTNATESPGAVENAVWVQYKEPSKNNTCGAIEHTHVEGECVWKKCSHKDGHISSCYGKFDYAVCPGKSDTTHTHAGTVMVTDVVELEGINFSWNEEHPAYKTVKTYFDSLKITEKLKILRTDFCFSVPEGATPDLCKHTCSAIGGDCYTTCIIPEHTHNKGCVTTTYYWELRPDVNKNGEDDTTEKYTIKYMKNNETVVKEIPNLSYGADTPTIDDPEGEEGYVFDGWEPEVAEKVTAPTPEEGNTITYTAKWKPDKDENKDGIPDSQQKCTIKVLGNDESIKINNSDVNLVEGQFSQKIDMKSGKYSVVIKPAEGKYLSCVTLNDENVQITDASLVTVEFEAGIRQTYNIVVESEAKKVTQLNAKENPTVYYVGEKIEIDSILQQVFASVTTIDNREVTTSTSDIKVETKKVVLLYEYKISKKIGSSWMPLGDSIDAGLIRDAVGTYMITVYYPGSEKYLASEKTNIEFKVVDGRVISTLELQDAIVHIQDIKDVPVDEETIIKALYKKALAGEDEIEKLGLSVSAISKYNEDFKEFIPIYLNLNGQKPEISEFGKYKVTIVLAETNTYGKTSAEAILEVVDDRIKTEVLLNEGVTLTYSETMTEQDVYNAVLKELSINSDDGIVVALENIMAEGVIPVYGENMHIEIDNLNAGTHTVTVKFDGDNKHAASSATCEITITKADAKVNVESKTVNYSEDSVNVSGLITASPNAKMIKFAVGINLGDNASTDAGSVAYVSIPSIINVNDIKNETIKQTVESALASLEDGSTMSISEFRTVLEGVLNSLKYVEGYLPINIDMTAIDALVSALKAIEGIEGIGSLSVKLLVGKDITVKDSGMYITGGVVSDSNYNTAVNVGYLLIAPNATKVKLAFNVNDDNGIITRDAILNEVYDLGSHVVEDGLSKSEIKDATDHLKNLYIGVDINGKSVVSDEASAEIGAYTQIAFISDLGNEIYYAVPIVRSYVVVADTAIVKFVDDNGNENNDRIFTYDGNQHGMTAVATDRDGNELPSENISYKYIGIEGDCEGYNSSEAPKNAGAYTVIATYLDADHTYVGMAIGAMVISPAEATITVNDTMHTYDGNAVDVTAMIEKTPDDAEMAVIMAGIDVNGDFSENGWAAVAGVVNIDFPTRVDDVLKTIVPKAYEDGIKLSDFTGKITEIKEKFEAAGIKTECMDRIVEILNQVPDSVRLTFKEQNEVNPSNIGAYLVGAVIMDPDYKAVYDTGVLVIAPEVTKAELKWKYEDENGVITSPILGSIDLGATAYVNGTEDKTLTGDIQYLFYGVDAEGNEVRTTDASTLTNGVYTQMAYVKAENISASMTVAAPIMRPIVIVPQTVTVEFVDDTGAVNNDRQFTYDTTQKAMPVRVTQMDGTQVSEDRLTANLTVRYIGVDSLAGAYDSTIPPTNVGAYKVIATYVEKDANGQILYAGATVGAMVIKPQDVRFEVVDTTVAHNGNEQFAEIINEAGMDYVAVIVDEGNNVNILLPASWNIKSTTVEVSENIDKILGMIGTLPADAQSTKLIQDLKDVLGKIKINTLTINGTKPTEIGTYKITALAYAANTNVVVDSGVLTITHDWSSDYTYDDEKHWKECNYCHEKAEEDAHKGGIASCTKQAVCSVCGQKYGTANGHSFGDWYDVNSPDCTNKGSQRRDCSECSYFETKDLDPNGHQWDEDYTVDKEPTCISEGSKSIHCSVCDAKKDSITIPKTDHTEGEPVTENEKAATCTEAGSYETVVYCTVCSTELSRELVVLPATGHSYGEWIVEKEATTTETGLKKHVCSVCGAEETEIIPMIEGSGSTTTPGDGGQGTTPGGNGQGTTPDQNGIGTTNTNKDTTKNNVENAGTKAAQTGDHNTFMIWIALLGISLATLFALVRSKRKRS